MYSPVAENLIMGTAAQESGFTYIKQLGGGPALGMFQVEPATAEDILFRYLKIRRTSGSDLKKSSKSCHHAQ